jgi:hypothetical protein
MFFWNVSIHAFNHLYLNDVANIWVVKRLFNNIFLIKIKGLKVVNDYNRNYHTDIFVVRWFHIAVFIFSNKIYEKEITLKTKNK